MNPERESIMTPVIILVCIFLVAESTSGAGSSKSEKCQKASEFGTRAISELQTTIPKEVFQTYTEQAEIKLGFHVTDKTARDTFLCNIADATNLHEFYEALPKQLVSSYEDFETYYNDTVDGIIATTGGYTNLKRTTGITDDFYKWKDQLKPGKSLQEMTDLATLTKFFQVMQVKYGSRWVSLLLGIRYQNFLIEDSDEFAKKLYESDSETDLAKSTGLQTFQVGALLDDLTGSGLPPLSRPFWLHLYNEAFELMGDLGIFNLKP